ncbi:unnamed protein product [Moneuplotes crassus]|uniref:MULE transposase domain-containing protein n=1 Tax=Euplotes crassus TaxID=5936 RepID=A0AAD2D3E5_EUPCR|nr:unnamed protein product [Moneuplotes crassus]
MSKENEINLVIHYKDDRKEQKVKISKDFTETKKNILNVFGINDKETNNYCLKIPSGGLIEESNVIFDNDKLCIIPSGMECEPTGCTPMDEYELKIKQETMKDMNIDPKNSEAFRKFQYTKITKSDYDILGCLLLTKQYTEYHSLSDLINKKWAQPLGFQMKMVRPPKTNKDGTKTIRLYCLRFSRAGNKKNQLKNPETGEEEENCKFGITFKQDNETKIWLLYQEFEQSNFIHNHKCNDRPKNLELNLNEYDVAETCKNYKRRIKSLIRLQRLIDQKSDLVVKQKFYIDEKSKREKKIKVKKEMPRIKKEKPDSERKNRGESHRSAQRASRNISAQQEINLLVECLQQKGESISSMIELDEDVNESGRKKTNKLFYSNEEMRAQYMKFRDFIYIHRRMNETRFGKYLSLICGVDNHGFNTIFGFSLTSKDDIPSNEWIFSNFSKFMGDSKPRVVIIERNKNLQKALTSVFPASETKVVYCPHYIHKSLKFEFDGDLRSNNETLYDKIVNIPVIESQSEFESRLAEVKNYALMTNNDRHRNLILKLESEKDLWAACFQKHLFLGGVVICDRIAKIKSYLKVFFAKSSRQPINESFSKLLEINSKSDLKGTIESRTISFKHNQIFMNFKFIRTLTNQNAVSEYVKERVKWFASKSFKYEISQADEKAKVFLVSKKKELEVRGRSRTYGDHSKVVVIDNCLFCTCLDQFNTGIPCAHEFCVHMKNPDYNVRLNKRWYRGFSEKDYTPDELNKYMTKQADLRKKLIQYMKSIKSNIKITQTDFSFKNTDMSLGGISNMEKIVEDADSSLIVIKVKQEAEAPDLSETDLKKLLEGIDPENIDLEELEKLITHGDEEEDDENYDLGKEFNRKMENKKKREELREKLKQEKMKKREAKLARKTKPKEKKIEKKSLKDLMKSMNTSSKLNFTELLLEMRKKVEEEKKIKEEAKSAKKARPAKGKSVNNKRKKKQDSSDSDDSPPKHQKKRKKKDESDSDSSYH